MVAVKGRAARLSSGAKPTFLRSVVYGVAVALLSGVLLLLLSALLLYRVSDPLAYFPYVAAALSLLLSLFGGGAAGRARRSGGALPGIAVGLTLAFLFLAAALILSAGRLPLISLPLYLGIILASTGGGAFATRKRRRKRRRR